MKFIHAIVLGVVLVVAFAKPLAGQAGDSREQDSQAQPNERDVAAMKKVLLSESTDMEEIAKSLNGSESETAILLDGKAQYGVMELDATAWFLATYNRMQCDPDREVAKTVLKNRLGFYTHMLGLEADQAAGYLALTKLPGTAQLGLQIKDNLRSAQGKLDEIAASLK
jgi:hypothetical protein